MTLAEKIAQMRGVWAGKGAMLSGLDFDPAKASMNFPDGIGALGRPSDKRGTPGIGQASGGIGRATGAPRGRRSNSSTRCSNGRSRSTRLGIPVLLHEESLHGYMATQATMFPQAIAMAGTFDTDLMRRVQAIIAGEVRARGVFYVLSPVVDIVRDPRWGRIEETYGEDPYLVSRDGRRRGRGAAGRRQARAPAAGQGLRHAQAYSPATASPTAAPTSGRPKPPSATCARTSSRRSAR